MQNTLFGILGIGLAAGAGAVVNHLIDRRIDAIMMRTERRPIPVGIISPSQAILFALVLGTIGLTVLAMWVNILTAVLTFATLIGYAIVYTVFLKRATPQNIVIGGLAGAMPPLLGWTAITGHIEPGSLLLVLIIFTWTPPHFWALSIHRYDEYKKAKIPMLPVTHGIRYTKLSILLYTALMIAVTLLPFTIGMSGIIYLIGAIILGARFLYWAIKLNQSTMNERKIALKTFRYSIFYLMTLYVVLLIDHYISIL